MVAKRIPVDELQRKLESDEAPLVVDVREPKEIREGGGIPGAISIPIRKLEERHGELPADAEIVFY